MNELKFLEAVNMIDNDLVEEADADSIRKDISSAPASERENITVSGVENYRSSNWHKFAAVASVFLLSFI